MPIGYMEKETKGTFECSEVCLYVLISFWPLYRTALKILFNIVKDRFKENVEL